MASLCTCPAAIHESTGPDCRTSAREAPSREVGGLLRNRVLGDLVHTLYDLTAFYPLGVEARAEQPLSLGFSEGMNLFTHSVDTF